MLMIVLFRFGHAIVTTHALDVPGVVVLIWRTAVAG